MECHKILLILPQIFILQKKMFFYLKIYELLSGELE